LLSGTLKFREPILFFENRGADFAARVAGKAYPSRGLAIGDLNDDGAVDAVVANNGDSPVLLWGVKPSAKNWVGLNFPLRPTGAVIRWRAGDKEFRKSIASDGSYLSAHDPRVVLGLGKAAEAEWVEVEWRGRRWRLDRLAGGMYYASGEP
jgi:enediyne biosynthesis protein E4